MTEIGGQYLHPITFISNTYKNFDFHETGFWKNEQKSWGDNVVQFEHSSYPPIQRFKSSGFSSKILISKDGLIASELPEKVSSDEEALIILSHHLNSFLGLINFGGLFFHPFSEKEISHIELKDGAISQVSACGDSYSQTNLKRALHRFPKQIPYILGTPWIDFDWVGMRIIKKSEIDDALALGKAIVSSEHFGRDTQILALVAHKEYTLHNWNSALVLSWTFIEMLIDELWKKEMIENVSTEEIGRKKRLKDYRTYSSAIKIEVLYIKSIIDIDTYVKLNQLRKLRNDFIHEGMVIAESDLNIFFEIVNIIIEITTGKKPLFNYPGWTRLGGWIEK